MPQPLNISQSTIHNNVFEWPNQSPDLKQTKSVANSKTVYYYLFCKEECAKVDKKYFKRATEKTNVT